MTRQTEVWGVGGRNTKRNRVGWETDGGEQDGR